MFEHKDEELLSPRHFVHRLLRTALWALLVVLLSLALGVAGYRFLGGLPWLDALLNASMILGGMGPVDAIKSAAGKLFASFYALYSGLVLIGLMGFLLAPLFHRILHSFHETKR
jgi:hypothetical protein